MASLQLNSMRLLVHCSSRGIFHGVQIHGWWCKFERSTCSLSYTGVAIEHCSNLRKRGTII